MAEAIEVGDRVIRASARSRSADVLGTVLEQADSMLRVGFENRRARWVHRSLLRRLGESGDLGRCPDALAEWNALPSEGPTDA